MDNTLKSIILTPLNLLYSINPTLALRILFKLKLGYSLNLDNPRTYNEKLQWIKLYDKNPLMAICCDKYEVRNYVAAMNCDEYLNELYWEGRDPETIPFGHLPNQFVIKVTHGSTFNIICKNVEILDIATTKRKLKRWLSESFLPCYGEWFYGVIEPRIIIERYLEGDDGQLRDYKVFCFDGKAKLIRVDSDRFTNHKADFFDCDWNRLEQYSNEFGSSSWNIKKPECLERMLSAAEILSAPFRHARIDFYIVEGQPIFGEITFTNGAGFEKLNPYEFDEKMGDWITLT